MKFVDQSGHQTEIGMGATSLSLAAEILKLAFAVALHDTRNRSLEP
jgi:hypothetical protein